MRHYAQTNIQLCNQLHYAGYSEADLARASSAYALAAKLFTGCFRPSGKVFLAHLVGTASILGELRRPIDTVVAGLLHSVYTHGEFGDGKRGISERKRAQLRSIIGREAEELIAAYTNILWDEHNILLVQQRLSVLNGTDREALLMRLANELEDHLDLIALYSGHVDLRRRAINLYLHHCVDIAKRLGFPSLSVELANVFEATLSTDLPDALTRTHESYKSSGAVFLLDFESSFLLSPISHRARAAWRLRRFLRQQLQVRLSRFKLALARLIRLPSWTRSRIRNLYQHGQPTKDGL